MFTELNEQNSKTTYASISNGLIVVRTGAEDPKGKARINKLGNEIYERFYRSIGGKIKSITVEENKFGETDIKVGIENGDQLGILTFKKDSSYGRSFMSQIFNVDFTRPVEFTPWSKVTEEGTKKTRLYLSYGKRESVEWKLPEGTPVVKWIETKKGKVMDPVSAAEHEDFLDNKINELIEKNNLSPKNKLSDISEDEWNDMTKPLTGEEKAQLKKPTADKVKSNPTDIKDMESLDDLFD